MTTYKKKEVTELGRKRIKKIRTILIPLSCILFPTSIVLFVLYFIKYPSSSNLMMFGIILLSLSVGFVIGILVTNNPLKEGTIYIKNQIDQHYIKENREVNDRKYSPQYKAEELYALLMKNDEVEYFDSKDFEVTPVIKKARVRRVTKESPDMDHCVEIMEEYYGDD